MKQINREVYNGELMTLSAVSHCFAYSILLSHPELSVRLSTVSSRYGAIL